VSATAGTTERIDLEDALKKFGPGNAAFQNEFPLSRRLGKLTVSARCGNKSRSQIFSSRLMILAARRN